MERYSSRCNLSIRNHLWFISLGYPSADNTWEPASHVLNCQDLLKEFEEEQQTSKRSPPSTPAKRTNKKLKRSTLSPSTKADSRTRRSKRSPARSSSGGRPRKRSSNDNSLMTDDEDEDFPPKKAKQQPRRSRKSMNDSENTPSYVTEDDNDVFDTAKLEKIIGVRRNKRADLVEYQIQLKKGKKPLWVSAAQLAESYSQEIVDFLQQKYVE